MSSNPTLSGAQRGQFRPWREVPGGICMSTEDLGLIRRPCALRPVSRRYSTLCMDYARQYLSSRGDGKYLPGQIGEWEWFFQAHFALIEVPQDEAAKHKLLFELPPTLTDDKGKLNPGIAATLPLQDAVDGELTRLWREYEILRETETPETVVSHPQWEAIVAEGKEHALKTLVSRHGSSALIQVLHGMGRDYPE